MDQLEIFQRNFATLRERIVAGGNNITEADYERYRQIFMDLLSLNRKAENAITNIDRTRIGLSQDELNRIDEDERSDRILDRVKPFLLLSQMLELMEEEQVSR